MLKVRMSDTGFAAPTGFGDFAIALWLKWSKAVPAALWFNILGLFDLFIALLTGVTGFGAHANQMTNIDDNKSRDFRHFF